MAITATTLSGAITSTQTSFGVASATGITAPNNQTGAGIIILKVDLEYMLVYAITGTVVSVVRGYNGSAAQAHVTGSQVQIGATPADFATDQMEYTGTNFSASVATLPAVVKPAIFLAGLADAIPAGVAAIYVIKSAAADLMTLAAPTLAQEGNVIEIWSDAAFAHTLTATSLLANGTALKTTATWPAFRGAGLILCARNLVYHVMSTGAATGTVVI